MYNSNFIVLNSNNVHLNTSAARSLLTNTKPYKLTIIFTEFVNITLNNPLHGWSSSVDSSLITKVRSTESGMIAKKLSIKTVVGFQERAPATLPKGIKTRRTLTLLLAAKSQIRRQIFAGHRT